MWLLFCSVALVEQGVSKASSQEIQRGLHPAWSTLDLREFMV